MSHSKENLVLHLKLDEIIEDGDNKKVSDALTGSLYNVQGNPQVVTDEIFGNCLSFDGTDDYISCDNINIAKSSFTIELWVKQESATKRWNLVLGQGTNESHKGLHLGFISGQKFRFSFYTNDLDTPAYTEDTHWHHYACVYDYDSDSDRGSPVVYRDGEKVAEDHDRFPYQGTGELFIGHSLVFNSFFRGKISHVRIYNKALSPEEIKQDVKEDTDSLTLHLKLDELVNQQFVDSSGNSKKAVITPGSSPQLILDDEFGHVAHFNGTADYIELDNTEQLQLKEHSFTVEAWIKLEQEPPDNDLGFPLLSTHIDRPLPEGLILTVIKNGFRMVLGENDTNHDTRPISLISLDEWHHIAFVYDLPNQTLRIYHNAHLVIEEHDHVPLQGINTVMVGRYIQGAYFQGFMSNLRIYNAALSPAQIKSDMFQDNANYSFHNSYPLEWNLHDLDKQNVLYIEDSLEGRTVNLEITNTSRETIVFNSIEKRASRTNYHFAVHFRKGTLADTSLSGDAKISLSSGEQVNWDLHLESQTNPNQEDVIYLVKRNNLSISPDESLSISLKNVAPSGRQGARGTRAQLLTDNLRYIDSSVNQVLKTTRTNQISIINHRGEKNIPLHVGFIGSNTVLNDGSSPNDLKLRITNIHPVNPERDGIQFKHDLDNSKRSKIILSFNFGNDEWDLQKSSVGIEISNPFLEGEASSQWVRSDGADSTEAISGEWAFHLDSQDQIIPQGHSLLFDINGIVTDLPTGLTHLYVRYENIPGYWDGQFVVPIEKQPLIMRKDRIGIGTNSPKTELDVVGTVQANDFIGNRIRAKLANIYLDSQTGNVGINTATPSNSLTIAHPGNANQVLLEGGWEDSLTSNSRLMFNAHLCGIGAGHYTHTPGGEDALVLWTLKAANRGILFASTDEGDIQRFSEMQGNMFIAGDTGYVGIGAIDPKIRLAIGDNDTGLHQQGDGELAIFTNNYERIRIDSNGNVGIGVIDPKIQLAIGDNDTGLQQQGDGELAVFTNNYERIRIDSNGNVGIGSNPSHKLHVRGSYNLALFESIENNAYIRLANKEGLEKRVEFANRGGGKAAIWVSDFGDALSVLANGNVGIGIENPTQGKLVVSGYANAQYINSFQFMSHSDAAPIRWHSGWHARRPENAYWMKYSIFTSEGISAPVYVTHSDQRIKKIEGKSNSEKDLKILAQIEITDYFYKDPISMGNTPQKKVIAQQVERVFPQAVSKNLTEVVPDIYKKSKVTEGGMIHLENHGLQIGEKVRLIFEQEEGETSNLYEVLHVSPDDFQVKTEYIGSVFVYGRQVDDFHQVDLEAISMLNVSATQELYKRLEAQENEIEELKDLVARQASQIEQLLELCNQGSIE